MAAQMTGVGPSLMTGRLSVMIVVPACHHVSSLRPWQQELPGAQAVPATEHTTPLIG